MIKRIHTIVILSFEKWLKELTQQASEMVQWAKMLATTPDILSDPWFPRLWKEGAGSRKTCSTLHT